MNPLVINFTPTGMIPVRSMTPHVPVTPQEIIEQVHEAYEVGITMAHLHAREIETEVPTYKAEIYRDILEGVRKHCPGLIVCISLSGRNFNTFEKRSEAIELYPDMGSLTLSSLNFPRQASVNAPDMIVQLAEKMNAYGVKPELEVFDLGMVNYAHYLIRKGILQAPYYFNLLYGNVAGMQADMTHVGVTIRDLPPDSYWSLAGIGGAQLPMNMMAIAMGGGVRVGLEDNIYWDNNRTELATNIGLVKRIHDLADLAQRRIMKPEELGSRGFYNSKLREQIPG